MKISTNTYVGFHFQRRNLIFGLLLTILLSACSPASSEPGIATPTVSQPTQQPTPESTSALSDEEIDSYTKTIQKYLPADLTAQILEHIPAARAIISGEPYDDTLSNQERQILAFAIIAELENQRGIQPLFFESDGHTYFYDSTVEDIYSRWVQQPVSRTVEEKATVQLYVPLFPDQNSGDIYYFWEGKWNLAIGSAQIDFAHIIDNNNMYDGTIDFSATDFYPFTKERIIINIPMICLDDKKTDIEVFPYNSDIGGSESIVFFSQLDFLLVHPNSLFGLNTKLVVNGQTPVAYPNQKDAVWFSSVYGSLQYFDGLFIADHTYYVGASPETEQTIQEWDYSTSIIYTGSNIDNLFINPDIFWSDNQNSSFIQVMPIFFYDGT